MNASGQQETYEIASCGQTHTVVAVTIAAAVAEWKRAWVEEQRMRRMVGYQYEPVPRCYTARRACCQGSWFRYEPWPGR